MATARCIVRALFTTCGRNIRPSPNSSPTRFIPAMSGPSTTANAPPAFICSISASSRPVSLPATTSRSILAAASSL